MRIAVDGRPLCHPHTGIGVYTFELLVRMTGTNPLLWLRCAWLGGWFDHYWTTASPNSPPEEPVSDR